MIGTASGDGLLVGGAVPVAAGDDGAGSEAGGPADSSDAGEPAADEVGPSDCSVVALPVDAIKGEGEARGDVTASLCVSEGDAGGEAGGVLKAAASALRRMSCRDPLF